MTYQRIVLPSADRVRRIEFRGPAFNGQRQVDSPSQFVFYDTTNPLVIQALVGFFARHDIQVDPTAYEGDANYLRVYFSPDEEEHCKLPANLQVYGPEFAHALNLLRDELSLRTRRWVYEHRHDITEIKVLRAAGRMTALDVLMRHGGWPKASAPHLVTSLVEALLKLDQGAFTFGPEMDTVWLTITCNHMRDTTFRFRVPLPLSVAQARRNSNPPFPLPLWRWLYRL